jgi:hypothetical protein
VQLFTVSVAPPAFTAPAPDPPKLFKTAQLNKVSVPKFSIPPPLAVPVAALAIVNPEIVVVTPAGLLKTRHILLPLIVSVRAPGPMIVTFLVMANGPLVSAIVLFAGSEKSIVSSPTAAASA